jgi:hypothetical protein
MLQEVLSDVKDALADIDVFDESLLATKAGRKDNSVLTLDELFTWHDGRIRNSGG